MAKAKQLAGIGDEAVFKATGKTWAEWLTILDTAGAKKMSHKEIAIHVHDELKCPSWWSQMVTVGYEQARGLREKHQKADGFSVSVSKTIAVPVAQLFAAWHDPKTRRKWLGAEKLAISKSTANKSIRATWSDGATKVEVNYYAKGDGKSQVTVQHDRLTGAKAAQTMKAFWRETLGKLEGVLNP